mmetsp:Transcript_56150/g.147077  ORF Transcript_56150/g.147077 Transcript_56150/m.147077 type:complete len:218 (-) Transcript_56150:298-951(-)
MPRRPKSVGMAVSRLPVSGATGGWPLRIARLARKCWRALSAEGRAAASNCNCAAAEAAMACCNVLVAGLASREPRASTLSQLADRFWACMHDGVPSPPPKKGEFAPANPKGLRAVAEKGLRAGVIGVLGVTAPKILGEAAVKPEERAERLRNPSVTAMAVAVVTPGGAGRRGSEGAADGGRALRVRCWCCGSSLAERRVVPQASRVRLLDTSAGLYP